MALATAVDVGHRLGRTLTTEEQQRAELGLLDEASLLVLAYLGLREEPATVPLAVTVVTSRMVARVLTQGGGTAPVGAEQASQTMGPFSESWTFSAGSTSGAPWLTAVDKTMLRQFVVTGAAFAIDTVSTAAVIHAEICALVFGALYCSCGADIAGVPLYETDGA